MRAVRLTEYGGPGFLTIADVPDPSPAPGELRVRVSRCGLNRADVSYTFGEYGGISRAVGPLRTHDSLPTPVGIQCAGVVDQVAANVAGSWVGRRVLVVPRFGCGQCAACVVGNDHLCPDHRTLASGTPDRGGLDELLCVPASHVVEIPQSLTMEQAAAVAADTAPAWWIVHELAGMRAGMRVAVKGASGNVGLAVLAIAKLVGAESIAITRTADKADALLEAGANRVLVCEPTHAAQAVAKATAGGADIVMEPFGGASFADSLACARYGGSIAVIGSFVQAWAETDLRVIFRKTLRIVGASHSPMWAVHYVVDLMSCGLLLPCIGPVVPMSEVQKAYALANDSLSLGKVIVDLE